MGYDVPIYDNKRGKYIIISDIKEGHKRRELGRFIFGKLQPLIQGKDGAITDAVFLEDYLEFLSFKQGNTLDK